MANYRKLFMFFRCLLCVVIVTSLSEKWIMVCWIMIRLTSDSLTIRILILTSARSTTLGFSKYRRHLGTCTMLSEWGLTCLRMLRRRSRSVPIPLRFGILLPSNRTRIGGRAGWFCPLNGGQSKDFRVDRSAAQGGQSSVCGRR